MPTQIYKTIDLFAGIGGIRLGFEKTGRCENVFSAEIPSITVKTFQFPGAKLEFIMTLVALSLSAEKDAKVKLSGE